MASNTQEYVREKGLLGCVLLDHRRVHVETMDHEISPFVGPAWKRSRQQACHCGESISVRARRKAGAIDDEARIERHSGIERPPCDIDPCEYALPKEPQREPGQREWPKSPLSSWQQTQARIGGETGSHGSHQHVGWLNPGQCEPEAEVTQSTREKSTQLVWGWGTRNTHRKRPLHAGAQS